MLKYLSLHISPNVSEFATNYNYVAVSPLHVNALSDFFSLLFACSHPISESKPHFYLFMFFTHFLYWPMQCRP